MSMNSIGTGSIKRDLKYDSRNIGLNQ